MEGYVYLLRCSDGSYYTGSTVNLARRIQEHENGIGANFTRKKLPIELVYCEQYPQVSEAFYREKQIQGWSRAKKEALTNRETHKLPDLAIAYRDKEILVELGGKNP
ncbi:MAG: GIY-YIG nuclease family protein [Bacteroidota bacterium]